NSRPSTRRTNSSTSPPVEQAPKQCHVCRSGSTTNEGVRSVWNGQRALKVRPSFFNSGTYPVTTSTISRRLLMSSIVLMVYLYRHHRARLVTRTCGSSIRLDNGNHRRLSGGRALGDPLRDLAFAGFDAVDQPLRRPGIGVGALDVAAGRVARP